MNLQNAIGFLESDIDDPGSVDPIDLQEAEQIGREAILKIILYRQTFDPQWHELLPGETPNPIKLRIESPQIKPLSKKGGPK